MSDSKIGLEVRGSKSGSGSNFSIFFLYKGIFILILSRQKILMYFGSFLGCPTLFSLYDKTSSYLQRIVSLGLTTDRWLHFRFSATGGERSSGQFSDGMSRQVEFFSHFRHSPRLQLQIINYTNSSQCCVRISLPCRESNTGPMRARLSLLLRHTDGNK